MNNILGSITTEFRRYKGLGERAVEQLTDADLLHTRSAAINSVAVLMSHIAGNLKSRFTDFLTSDGEKPWRNRDAEFVPRRLSRVELFQQWEDGWNTLFLTLDTITDHQLSQSVVIRGQSLSVHHALHRALAHISYHVGQMVYVARELRGESWHFLSIPPGKSADYNENPTLEVMPTRPIERPGSPST